MTKNLLALLLLSFSSSAFAGTVAVVTAESTIIIPINVAVAVGVGAAGAGAGTAAIAPTTTATLSQATSMPTVSLASFTPAGLTQIQTLTQSLITGGNLPAALQVQLETLLQNVETALSAQAGNPVVAQ